MLVKPDNQPDAKQDLEVMISWLSPAPLRESGTYALKRTTKDLRCIIKEVKYKLDINTLHRVPNDRSVGLNDIARVQLRVTQPVFFDSYKESRGMGSMILIDEHTNDTVAAGMTL